MRHRPGAERPIVRLRTERFRVTGPFVSATPAVGERCLMHNPEVGVARPEVG